MKSFFRKHPVIISVTIVFVVALVILSVLIFRGIMTTSSKTKEERHLHAIEEVRKEYPESVKIPLTEEFLKEEYEIFVKANGSWLLYLLIALALILFYGIVIVLAAHNGTIGFHLLKYGYTRPIHDTRKKNIRSRFTVVHAGIAMSLTVLVFVGLLGWTLKITVFKKPEIRVSTIKVNAKNMEVVQSTGVNGEPVINNKYYLYYGPDSTNPDKLSVSFDIYNQVEKLGVYYLAYVEGVHNYTYVGIYPDEEFERVDQ